jgi:hypothetical protein
MSQRLRLSEHPASQKWLLQFGTEKDRNLAAHLLNQLKLVSLREFESNIEKALSNLQSELNETIAVYPVAPPIFEDISGYDPFDGAIARKPAIATEPEISSRHIGRRRKYGSEDRVGHLLAKLQERFKRGSGASVVECQPTLNQLKTQGIRHIVLVDDICGSGRRITEYWRAIPKRIKSLLSLKKCELWIVLYGIMPAGRHAIEQALPNFPIKDHLITILPETDLGKRLSIETADLCVRYAEQIDRRSAAFGFRGSSCPIIFEHGCPNNLPVVLWEKNRIWSGLFPNRSIPNEMRVCFDDEGLDRAVERLWRSNQPNLALGLLDAVDKHRPLKSEDWILLTVLGLRLRGVTEANLAKHVLIKNSECRSILKRATRLNLYDNVKRIVTQLGIEFVDRFRRRHSFNQEKHSIGRDPLSYYPKQCEGNLLNLVKLPGL